MVEHASNLACDAAQRRHGMKRQKSVQGTEVETPTSAIGLFCRICSPNVALPSKGSKACCMLSACSHSITVAQLSCSKNSYLHFLPENQTHMWKTRMWQHEMQKCRCIFVKLHCPGLSTFSETLSNRGSIKQPAWHGNRLCSCMAWQSQAPPLQSLSTYLNRGIGLGCRQLGEEREATCLLSAICGAPPPSVPLLTTSRTEAVEWNSQNENTQVLSPRPVPPSAQSC